MKASVTPASVRCDECGAEPGDPHCYTRDDEPTGYHAARRAAAEAMKAEQRQQRAVERRARAAARQTEDALRAELRAVREENRRLRDALAMVASVARAAGQTANRRTGAEDE